MLRNFAIRSLRTPLTGVGIYAPRLLRTPRSIQPLRTFRTSRLIRADFKEAAKQTTKSVADAVEQGSTTGVNKKLTLKELVRKYGWSAVGVYMGLSAIDLPICFLFVHSMGQERAVALEKSIKGFFGWGTADSDLSTVSDPDAAVSEEAASDTAKGTYTWSVFLTEFAVAYAIHKSVFIFVRVPLTAAVTPSIVKKLQSWGFNIGNGGSNAARLGTSPNARQKWTSWFS